MVHPIERCVYCTILHKLVLRCTKMIDCIELCYTKLRLIVHSYTLLHKIELCYTSVQCVEQRCTKGYFFCNAPPPQMIPVDLICASNSPLFSISKSFHAMAREAEVFCNKQYFQNSIIPNMSNFR